MIAFSRASRTVRLFVALLVAGAATTAARPASALPIFAQQYGLSCEKCHQVPPRLNAFGEAFQENGYRLPGFAEPAASPSPSAAAATSADPAVAQSIRSLETSDQLTGTVAPGPAFPIAARINLQSVGNPGPNFPHSDLDELELLAAGRVGPRLNYFAEQYLIDGGEHGLTRDAWMRYQATPYAAKIPVFVTAGQFTLPLPIDPESFRETATHYAIWDQTVGDNPFSFFDPKLGVQAQIGSRLRGTSLVAAAVNGHDRLSGIPTIGADTMLSVQHAMGDFALSVYRYDGRRPDDLRDPAFPAGRYVDRFQRTGYALVYKNARFESDTVLQTGWDRSFDGFGDGGASSGGFEQLRYQFTDRFWTVARVDGTNDAANGFARSGLLMAGYRTGRNSHVTLEDVLTHTPETHHDFALQFTTAY